MTAGRTEVEARNWETIGLRALNVFMFRESSVRLVENVSCPVANEAVKVKTSLTDRTLSKLLF